MNARIRSLNDRRGDRVETLHERLATLDHQIEALDARLALHRFKGMSTDEVERSLQTLKQSRDVFRGIVSTIDGGGPWRSDLSTC
jgi:hypothetical protein